LREAQAASLEKQEKGSRSNDAGKSKPRRLAATTTTLM